MAYSPLIPKYSLSGTPSMRSKMKREWKGGRVLFLPKNMAEFFLTGDFPLRRRGYRYPIQFRREQRPIRTRAIFADF
jgi:hypothetical protein